MAEMTKAGSDRVALPDVALFRDATEVLFALAEARHRRHPAACPAPSRHFVKDADEAHRIALGGPQPIVGMSLDDLLDCATAGDPHSAELVALCGVHRGFLELMARPGVREIADLKGSRIAIDTETGYARGLLHVLRQHGLERDRDFEIVYAGATNLRYEKLIAGGFDATLLGAPFTSLAAQDGYRSLGRLADALGGYQAIVLVAHRPWLAGNAAAAQAVRACICQTLAWACDAAHRPEVLDILAALLPAGHEACVEAVADDMFGAHTDFLRDGVMQQADVDAVVALFNGSSGRVIDPRVLASVLAMS